SAPAEVSAEFFAGVAPLTMKLAPGSAWNTGTSVGSLTQSCAQASRARSVSAASGLSSSRRSKRPPSSLLVSVALRELTAWFDPTRMTLTSHAAPLCCSRPLLGLPKRGKNAKMRAGLEFIRRISAMFIFSIRTVVLAVAVSASSLSSAATLSAQSELLCSPEGLMRLIPQFNVNAQFTIPNPNTDLQTFLSAQQGLSNAIDMILAQENISQNPSNVGSLPSRPLIFASNWLSSEVGIQTDGKNLNSPESGGKFGGYRVQSFLTGLTPVPLSQGSIYVIKQSNPTYQALVYPMPTSHPCVNRLFLAAGETAGPSAAPAAA